MGEGGERERGEGVKRERSGLDSLHFLITHGAAARPAPCRTAREPNPDQRKLDQTCTARNINSDLFSTFFLGSVWGRETGGILLPSRRSVHIEHLHPNSLSIP
ncbi:hypothetical protein ILYODFUR_010080 [Ilyodon furcidens]|uniref:Uncharacterized protein n=1 Tax=Ilyodon furcidens TaxID=33524 RepID=A0ABV0V4Q1_9TELE